MKQLNLGGMDGISCRHLQVLMTHLLQKHWEWQQHRDGEPKHGSLRHPTWYVASMDIKSAFDVAKLTKIAQILEEQNMHGCGFTPGDGRRGGVLRARPPSKTRRGDSSSRNVSDKGVWRPQGFG